ncbi:DUF805 domain-containing protein [Frondihabitans australicus]|uniref:Uncharacterized membrane protein YhaH (DUF805 family) n=1 Tax=Frondihabitans australicus TaxID=386892 RepID=A0A495IDY0_9MICO|nr:DUF805 domain-containing protein [Frondihabitans australicus]RKR74197.1 uncharacterized membrane protein YhaH (DUF805 family) [Frondihabitans australicus]
MATATTAPARGAERVRAASDGGPWGIFRSDDEAPIRRAHPLDAARRYWTKYAVFTGRASRSEFWFSWLYLTAGYGLILIGVPRLLGVHSDFSLDSGFLGPALSTGWSLANAHGGGLPDPWSGVGAVTHALLLTFTLVTFVPTMALGFRRMHDVGLPGWIAVTGLGTSPIVGLLFLAALFPSRTAGARYDRAVERIGADESETPDRADSTDTHHHSILGGRPKRTTVVRASVVVGLVAAATVGLYFAAVPATPVAAQGTWQLTAMRGISGPQRLTSEPIEMTLRAGSLVGDDTCNTFSADLHGFSPWRMSTVIATEMGCDDDSAARAHFADDLASVARASVDGDTLRLTGPNGVELDFVRT